MSLEVLKEARAAGVQLFLSDGQLKVRAEKGALTPALKSRILSARNEVVALLAQLDAIGSHDGTQRIEPASRTGDGLPLSFQQQRLWTLNEIQQGSAEYNIPMAFTVRGGFAPDTAQAAMRAIIARHEVLRSNYFPAAAGTVQRIRAEAGFHLGRMDLQALAGEHQRAALQTALLAHATRPFDLQEDLLVRASWIQLQMDVGVLAVNLHHIVADGWSLDILMREFIALYQAFETGRSDPLPPLPIQYADYAVWQRRHLSAARIEQQADYWRQQLAAAPLLHSLPLDLPRPARKVQRGASFKLRVPPALVQQLDGLASRCRLTRFMLIHAALSLLIARHGNCRDVLIGAPVANRLSSQLEPLIGFFVNVLVLRTQVDEDMSIEAYLQHVKDVNLGAQSHQEMPFEMLLEHLKLPRSVSHTPVFQIALAMDNTEKSAAAHAAFTVESREIGAQFAKYDLTLEASAGAEALELNWIYDAALFRPATIERFSRHLHDILLAFAASPAARLREVTMLSVQDRRQLLHELNDTRRAYDAGTPLPVYVAQHAATQPEQIAVRCRDASLDYRQLDGQANHLAQVLRGRGVRAEQRVGIVMATSIDKVVAILAVMKLGAVFVPLDAQDPELHRAVSHGALSCLLTDSGATQLLGAFADLALAVDGLAPAHACSAASIAVERGPDSVVCICGGVAVTQRALANYLDHAQREYLKDGLSGAVLIAPLAFVEAIGVLFAPLICGKQLVILPHAQAQLAPPLAYYLFEQGEAWLFKLTPAYLELLAAHLSATHLSTTAHSTDRAHVIVAGGEPLYKKTVLALRRAGLTSSVLINEYAHRELVGGCSTYTVPQEELLAGAGAVLPIGRPIQNTELFVANNELPCLDLDASRQPWAEQPVENLEPRALGLSPANLAYVIYTSGSTGQPKGVMIEHASITRLFTATREWFQFDHQDVWTLFHSFAFDFSVWEIWGALIHGGRLVVVPQATARSPEQFYELLCREGVTVLNQTPLAFRQLIQAQAGSAQLHRLREVIFGGEALDVSALQPWYARSANQHTRLVNMYGITETTVHVTYRPLVPADALGGSGSPIGRRIPDLTLYLLDAQRRPVPIGAVGEIYVGGAGVARGYLNRPELTAERFIDSPFGRSERLYKTGDLGRYLADGNLEYLGRNDFQVKIRGFRIELGEIEAQLGACAGVREAVVIAREDAPGEKRLVAYYTVAAGADISAETLRLQLSRTLASHMVPVAYVQLPALPLTLNGKLDRKALPAPEGRMQVTGERATHRPAAAQTQEPTLPFGLAAAYLQGDDVAAADQALDRELASRIGQCARALAVSTASIFHVAWAQLLARASGREAPEFGAAQIWRLDRRAAVLPVSIGLQDRSVEQCVRETQALLEQLHAQRASPEPADTPALAAALIWCERGDLPALGAYAEYPLSLCVVDEEVGFAVTARVARSVGAGRIIAMLVRVLEQIVESLAVNPARAVSELEVLTEEERQRLLLQWNQTQAQDRTHCIHELFEAQAARHPEAIAVVHEGRQLAYAELNRRANQLAHHLRAVGVRPEQRVALCMERSIELIVGLLAILKAGAGYVPLDPAYPIERLSYMLRDSGAVMVLTHAPARDVVQQATRGLGRESLAPFGAVGELYIAGDAVEAGGSGVSLELAPGSTRRLHRTGDLVRYNLERELEYCGRADEQVILRGLRVEPADIQAQLCAHPRVRDAVVLPVVQGYAHSLVAFVVPRAPLSSAAQERFLASLREWSSKHLAVHQQPTAYQLIPAMPLTPHGKVDRQALLRLPLLVAADGGYVAPGSEVERTLCAIYADLLGVERVGINDNFFALGGDSILCIQAVAKARKAGITLSAAQIFTHQTVAELAPLTKAASARAPSQDSTGDMPLLPIHRWFFATDGVAVQQFNQSVLLKIPAGLALATLHELVRALYLRHDALRLRFRQHDGQWHARFAAFDAALLERSCAAESWPATAGSAGEWIAARCEHHQRSMDLAAGPLFRAVHFTLAADDHRLFLVLHHAVVDGVSWRVLMADLEDALQQSAAGKALQLGERASSYQEWAMALERYAHSAALRAQQAYWLQQLQASAELPVDSSSAVPCRYADSQELAVQLSEEETQQLLRKCSHAYSMRTAELLMAALAIGLGRWLQRDRVLIALEGHGREELFPDLDVSGTVGWFTTLYPLALSCGPRPLSETLIAVKEQLRAIPGNGLGYGVLRHIAQDAQIVAAELGNAPQLIFNYLGQFDQAVAADAGLAVAEEDSGRHVSPQRLRSHKIAVNARIADGVLRFVWDYSATQYAAPTIARVAHEVVAALSAVIRHCCGIVSRVHTPSDFPQASVALEQLRAWQSQYTFDKLYRVTPSQQGMLAASELERTAYVIQIYATLRGHLDEAALQRAWQRVVARHDVLRTAFVTHESGLHQLVLREHPAEVRMIDLRMHPQAEREAVFERHRLQDKDAGFALNAGPAHRMALLRLGQDRWRLLFSYHHAVLDGWSTALVVSELFAAYQGADSWEPPAAQRASDYEQYVGWVQRQSPQAAKQYWKRYLGAVSDTALLRPAATLQLSAASYAVLTDALTREQTDALKDFAGRQRATLNSVVQLAWSWVLRCYTGKDDVVFGAVVSGRPAEVPGVESMVGLFVNTIPVRVGLQTGEIEPTLAKLQLDLAESNQHAYLSLIDIKREAGVRSDLDLFETIVDFKNYPDAELASAGAGSLVMEDQDAHDQNTFPVTLTFAVHDRLSVKCCYRDDLLPAGFIGAMIEDLLHVLCALPQAGSLSQIQLPGLPKLTSATHRAARDAARPHADPLVQQSPRSDQRQQTILEYLSAAEDVAEAAVTGRRAASGAGDYTLHVTARRSFDNVRDELLWLDDLRHRLCEQLPAAVIPNRIRLLRSLPRAAGGEVDELRLQQAMGRTLAMDAPERAASELEVALCRLLAGVLGTRAVSAADNFFDLGGDSMLALRLCGLARKQGIPITVAQIYRLQTIAQIAAAVAGQTAVTAVRAASAGRQALLPIQQQMLVSRSGMELNKLRHFNMASLFDVAAPPSMATLRAAASALLQRHDALRLEFTIEAGSWRGNYREYEERMLETVCRREVIATDSPAEARAEMARRCRAYHQGFDLAQAPLLRLVSFESAAGARLFLLAHHSVVDVLSWQVLVSDLRAALQAHAQQGVIALGAKTASYQEWGQYLQQCAELGSFAAEREYWLQQIPTVAQEFPCERAAGEPDTFGNLAHVLVQMTPEETASLLKDCQSLHGASINEVLIAALYCALRQWSGRSVHSLYIQSHGRHSETLDLAETVGWFTQMYPLALEQAGSVVDCIQYVKRKYRDVPNHGLGFGVLRHLCNDAALAEREARYPPQVVLNYAGQLDGFVRGAGDLEFSADDSGPIASDEHAMPYKLVFQGGVYAGCLGMTIEYHRRRFAAADIQFLADAFRAQLRQLTAVAARCDGTHGSASSAASQSEER